MHHYNFLISLLETGPVRAPGRREIGHGALGNTTIHYSDTTEFPYTVRIVSEVLESNGFIFTSINLWFNFSFDGCWCAIKAPVAGIAMGLVTREDSYTILTDIQGMEDALGYGF